MESPGKKFTDLVEIESIQDTDLAVVRNDTGVKKTPMQKLSDYIKQKFIGWVFSDLPTTDKTIPGALKELNSSLTAIIGGLPSSSGGRVEFTAHEYPAGECLVDEQVSTHKCTIAYMRLYYTNDRNILIGAMFGTEDPNWWSKYVATSKLLIQKQIGSDYFGWTSI